jgi:hypothetical protein
MLVNSVLPPLQLGFCFGILFGTPGVSMVPTLSAWLQAWRRNQILSEWRNKLQAEGKPVEGEPDYGDAAPGADTCRPDPKAPSVKLPLPFPQNELFIFCEWRWEV